MKPETLKHLSRLRRIALAITTVMSANVALAAGHDAHGHADGHRHNDAQPHDKQGSHARAHAAHVHGEGELTLAIDGKEIAITLTAPAESLIGFEHAPSTAEEKSRLQSVLTQLEQAGTLFDFDDSANCKQTSVSVTSPFENKTGATHTEHADIEAEYQFSCSHPEKIDTVPLPLLQKFPGLRTLKADFVTEKAQGSHRLTADTPALPLR